MKFTKRDCNDTKYQVTDVDFNGVKVTVLVEELLQPSGSIGLSYMWENGELLDLQGEEAKLANLLTEHWNQLYDVV